MSPAKQIKDLGFLNVNSLKVKKKKIVIKLWLWHLSIYLSTYLSIYLSIYLSDCLSVNQSINQSSNLSDCL